MEILTGLQIKHFVCDFILQKPYQYFNKGKYLHPGGLLHALLHAIGTLVVFCPFNFRAGIICAILDLFLHYHIDWAKVNICTKYGWKADNSEYYWWLLGYDQLLHQLTYIGFLWVWEF